MPEAFVTGATGFLGRHLCATLLEWGVGVRALVRKVPSSAHDRLPEGVEVTTGDLSKPRGRLIPPETDYVFHMAAKTSPPASAVDPVGVFETNAMATARLLEEVRTREETIARFVLASSSLVYAPSPGRRVREDGAQRPASPYAASKAAAEAHAFAYDSVYGVPVTVVRVFNAYGPHQAPNFVVPSIMAQCVKGGDVEVGNLWPVRDFIYAGDVVELFWRAARSPRGRGEAFNAGTGKGTSIEDLAGACIRQTGSTGTLRVVQGRSRRQETDYLVADTAKTRDLLGWRPATGLADGLRATADAIRTAGA